MLQYVLEREYGSMLAIEVSQKRGELAYRGGDLRTAGIFTYAN